MKIAITGATGFIGQQLIKELQAADAAYSVITRNAAAARKSCPGADDVFEWNPPEVGLDPTVLDDLDGVVHLAGATVARRWTASTKREIRDSRISSTKTLVEVLEQTPNPPKVLISASAIGFYGPRDATELTENAAPGTDFLATVCRDWEEASSRASERGVRVVNPRLGIVLGPGGGALAKMLTPFRMGVGGPIGNGKQWMSWIHLNDVTGLILHALTTSELVGPVNATAPEPVTNRTFSKALGRVLHRPAILPTPVLALKLMFGGFADVLATGQRVVPEKALAAGYRFRFPNLSEALADVV